MTSETSGETSSLEHLHREVRNIHNFIVALNLSVTCYILVQAINCLETFPYKIIELNAFINEYMPESVKNNKYDENAVGRKARCQSTLSTTKNCDLNSVSDFGGNCLIDVETDVREWNRDSFLFILAPLVSSYYSMSMCDRSRSRHGICKRKYYRSRGVTSCNGRRRPGPLGQLLAFIVSSLTACTKKIVIAPSKYLINNVVSTFFQR